MKKFTYLVTILLLISFGCKEEILVKKIDSSINIKLWESIDNSGKTLQFLCSTDKEYPCYNYQIDYSLHKHSNVINIHLDGIFKPGNLCPGAIGPANVTINLGSLTNGTYELQITINGQKNKGQLLVTSDFYKINFKIQEQIQFSNSTLNSIPEKTIWGIIGYHSSSTSILTQTFIDSLEYLGAINQTLDSGEYGYFEINSTGQIQPPKNHGYHFIQSFVYDYVGNVSDLEDLVKNYGQNFNDSLNIELRTARGEEFRSWIQ